MKTLLTTMLAGLLAVCAHAQTVIYVKANAAPGGDGSAWESAYTSIQDAIDAAADAGGGEVWVAGGTYTNPADPETGAMLVLRPGVSLYGGFAGDESIRAAARPGQHETRLDARTALDGGQADTVLLGAEGSTVDGFVVRGDGARILLQAQSDMRLNRLTLEENTSGGIRISQCANVSLKNVRLSGNEHPGALISIWNSQNVAVGLLVALENDGTVVSVWDSQGISLGNSYFVRNTGFGGIFLGDLEEPDPGVCPVRIESCWFEDSVMPLVTGVAGAVVLNSVFKLTVDPLVLRGPITDFEKSLGVRELDRGARKGEGEDGDGEGWNGCEGEPCSPPSVCPSEACPTSFSHCTFVSNTLWENDAFFSMFGGGLSVQNSLFFDNDYKQFEWHACDEPVVGHTLLEKDYPGAGNLVGDPGFAGPGNLRLGAGSIAIGAGLDASLPEHGGVATDITGRPRGAHGAGFDLGAYQSGHAADLDGNHSLSLGELLRLIQFYHSPGFHCDLGSEDGYAPGPGLDFCAPHSADYAPQDWVIGFSELLRVIQLYNSGAYHLCATGEDGFCPGTGTD